jgi:hypothetical protein
MDNSATDICFDQKISRRSPAVFRAGGLIAMALDVQNLSG